jgi:carbon-monoxide dehydrogenase iron sulfur subunit
VLPDDLRRKPVVKRIAADPKKCLACRTCEIACALAHAGTGDLLEAIRQGSKPRIYIEVAGSLAVPLQCRHCEDAPCVRVCPSGALSRPDREGPVLADRERCIGCAFCVEVCPFGVIRVLRGEEDDASGNGQVVLKCDLCIERQAQGLDPACVSACPVGALSFVEVDQTARQARRRTAAASIADGDH